MKRWRVFVMAVVLAQAFMVSYCFGEVLRYETIDLGTLGGNRSYAYGINDNGEVVGDSAMESRLGHQAFIWSANSGMLQLHSPDNSRNTIARAINNEGQVVGQCHFVPEEELLTPEGLQILYPVPNNFGDHAVIWDSRSNTMYDLGVSGSAKGINEAGEVVGGDNERPSRPFGTTPSYKAFIWDSINGVQALCLNDEHGGAYDINKNGQSVGVIANGPDPANVKTSGHAVLWENDGGIISLGTLGGESSSARAINNYGEVVGSSMTGEVNVTERQIHHAFIWNETDGITDIHQHNTPSSIAYGVNGAGQVVGCVFDGYLDHLRGTMTIISIISPNSINYIPKPSAFLWEESYGMVDLNELLEPGSGFVRLRSAEDINKKGQIVGYGVNVNGEMHAFLMSPVIKAKVEIRPKTLNLSSRRRWIGCRIDLPEGFYVSDIDTESILLEGQIVKAGIVVNEQQNVVVVKFVRSDIGEIFDVGEVELTVSGEFTDGIKFEGTDTIRVID